MDRIADPRGTFITGAGDHAADNVLDCMLCGTACGRRVRRCCCGCPMGKALDSNFKRNTH
jgi:hypothetical protein